MGQQGSIHPFNCKGYQLLRTTRLSCEQCACVKSGFQNNANVQKWPLPKKLILPIPFQETELGFSVLNSSYQ